MFFFPYPFTSDYNVCPCIWILYELFFEFLIFMVLFCIGFPVFSLCLSRFFIPCTHISLVFGICTPCICYTLYNVFVHYMVFLLGVLLYFIHVISILFYSIYLFIFFWYFACITHSVYLSFLCLSKLGVFIFSLSFKFFE